MEIKVFNNAEEIGATAANIIIDCINSNEKPVLGLATGASPLKTYNCLIDAYKNGIVSFKNVTTFNLDEYCGLPKEDKNSYWFFMHDNLFNKVDIDENNVNIPNGNPEDLNYFTDGTYDRLIEEAGGIDVQILGIGQNGHIGFNEPAESFTNGTFKVKLTDSTIQANKIYFESEDAMPREAVTMGVGSILKAKEIILIATGKAKAEAVKNMINGEVSPACPASALQNHANVHILLDSDAASLL